MVSTELMNILPQLASGAPHTHALGFSLVGVEGDVVTLKCPYREELVGDPDTGVLAGGVVTTLLDHVCGMAVWAALDRFTSIATLDLRIDYMRPAKPGLDLKARARCYKLTRSVAFVRAWAYDEDPDDPVAAAQAAFVLDSDGGRKPGANLKRGKAKA
ncbi:MAG: PaaI family thioesterase [Proteobacteria bacterium]|nr:PaaI family thioesterase [Pseudomonadota bacterium]